MIATDRGRTAWAWAVGLTLLGAATTGSAFAQQAAPGTKGIGAAKEEPTPGLRLDQIDVPPLQRTAVPVNPTDAIAIVNGQAITREQLADECVARKGKEILETLINRQLIEQALKAKKLEVTAAEIDQEINEVAQRFGIGRDAWLRTLDKERGITPYQYARDIVYPALAMRKLCAGRVQVTPEDLKAAFDAQYGAKLRCRMIMVDKLSKAQSIWEALRKNPAGFEKIAQEQSMDLSTRSLGGLLAEPITRNAHPKNVSDAAFVQLLDGDPKDTDPSHKPKDGDFTGPIQVSESTWVILRREEVIPATPNVSLENEEIREKTYEIIYEVKLKETMGMVFQELVKSAAIENRLVGSVKLANEEQDPDYRVDKEVKLMSDTGDDPAAAATPSAHSTAPAGQAKLPPPVAASPEVLEQFEKIHKEPIKAPATAAKPEVPATAAKPEAPATEVKK